LVYKSLENLTASKIAEPSIVEQKKCSKKNDRDCQQCFLSIRETYKREKGYKERKDALKPYIKRKMYKDTPIE
jgi:hypothetical protein